MLSSICLAQAGDPYAQPDGADAYGPKYKAEPVPSQMREFLDAQGRYTLPSFIDLTIERDTQECWVIDQIPPAGTVFTGPQTVTVQLMHTCGNAEELWAQLPIELIDITPPEVNLILDSNVTPHLSFGGVARYLSPSGGAAVAPIITVSDPCDANPAQEFMLDGAAYQLGTPITSIGLHILYVQAVDASGNRNDLTAIFEIRERPSHTAAAVVQSTQCEIDPGGETGTLTATLLISAENFDHHDIFLPSVRVMLRGPDGRYQRTMPLAIRNGYIPIPPCENVFRYENAIYQMNQCWVEIEVEGQFNTEPPGQCPATLEIIGAGLSNGQLAFEWGARTANVVDPTPAQTLMVMANKQEPCDPQPPPPPPPPPGCEQIETPILSPDSCSFPWTAGAPPCLGGSATASSTTCLYTAMGHSRSTALAPGSPCSTSSACPPVSHPGPTWGTVVLLEQMVGDCCNCVFTISVNANLRVSAQVSGWNTLFGTFTGDARASGMISFDSPCGSENTYFIPASAAASGGPLPDERWSSTPNPEIVSRSITLNCTDDHCTSFLMINTAARVQTEANANNFGSCDAESAIGTVLGNLTVTGTAIPCPPDPCDP